MRSHSDLEIVPKHIFLNKEDWDFLSSRYGPQGTVSQIGVSEVIRLIIHRQCQLLRSREVEHLDTTAATSPPFQGVK